MASRRYANSTLSSNAAIVAGATATPTGGTPLNFQDFRFKPLATDVRGTRGVIARVTMRGAKLPAFVVDVDPTATSLSQSGLVPTPYSVGVACFNGGWNADHRTVLWRPTNLTLPFPGFPANGVPFDGGNPYWWASSPSIFLDQVNQALCQSAKIVTEYQLGRNSTPSEALPNTPQFTWDGARLGLAYCQITGGTPAAPSGAAPPFPLYDNYTDVNNPNADLPATVVFMNGALAALFSTLPMIRVASGSINGGIITPDGSPVYCLTAGSSFELSTGYTPMLAAFLKNNAFFTGQPGSGLTATANPWNIYTWYADAPPFDTWTDVEALALTCVMPYEVELESPVCTGPTATQPNTSIDQSSILTDLTIEQAQGPWEWSGRIVFQPVPYRFFDATSGMLPGVNYSVVWRSNRDGQLRPVTWGPRGGVTVKLMLES